MYYKFSSIVTPLILVLGFLCATALSAQSQIKVGYFNVDATPPIGSPVAYAPARSIQDPLSARGIVLSTDEETIVLCAVDWIGIANRSQDVFQEKLAKAAGTKPENVSVHALHQHDGVRCDFTTAAILDEYGISEKHFDTAFLHTTINNIAAGVKKATMEMKPVTHVGFGEAKVEKVASNRRILGADGKVQIVRYSKSKDPEAIAAPEGTIDPYLKSVSFWNEDTPIVALTYYATHPQSYYGDGDVTCEFVGIARNQREKDLGFPHIHFTGAAGNVAAGKYNDGSKEMRPVLASRIEKGMKKAWNKTEKYEIKNGDIKWKTTDVMLPLAHYMIEDELTKTVSGEIEDPELSTLSAAKHLAWLQRTNDGHPVTLSALQIRNVQLLNLPGEIFVEYQLAAQKLYPGQHICTAAYEEYGPGYIGTKIAYTQGGYETSKRASRVSPEAEEVLLHAIKKVLK